MALIYRGTITVGLDVRDELVNNKMRAHTWAALLLFNIGIFMAPAVVTQNSEDAVRKDLAVQKLVRAVRDLLSYSEQSHALIHISRSEIRSQTDLMDVFETSVLR